MEMDPLMVMDSQQVLQGRLLLPHQLGVLKDFDPLRQVLEERSDLPVQTLLPLPIDPQACSLLSCPLGVHLQDKGSQEPP